MSYIHKKDSYSGRGYAQNNSCSFIFGQVLKGKMLLLRLGKTLETSQNIVPFKGSLKKFYALFFGSICNEFTFGIPKFYF